MFFWLMVILIFREYRFIIWKFVWWFINMEEFNVKRMLNLILIVNIEFDGLFNVNLIFIEY